MTCFSAACTFAVSACLYAATASAQPTRDVTYDPHAVFQLNAHLRMTTLIVLPESEDILDYVCGDKDFWIVSGAQNLAYVKPAKAGATTNLDLVTASGRIYSFLLVENDHDTDLKVFVVPDPKHPSAPRAPAVTAAGARELEQANQLAIARDDATQARRKADDAARAADRAKADYPFQIRFPYTFKARTKPFNVTAIFHDDRFTYIRIEGRELPAVYEVIDHVPNLVGYHVEQGVYVIAKVIDHGYLSIGKRRLPFDVVDR
jgi:type IV secretion system protein VirB9